MCETAGLDLFPHVEEERRVLEEGRFVDDILTSHSCLDQGCSYRFGHSGRWGTAEKITQKQKAAAQGKTIILPNQIRDEDNKALGDGDQEEEGRLYVLTSIYFWKIEEKNNKAGGRSEEGGYETRNTLSSEQERAAKSGSDPTG